MCIVSYIPTQNGFRLTSNRDEQVHRPTEAPKTYNYRDSVLIFPRDLEANGTWFAAHPKEKKVSCLLNAKGVFPDHTRRQSRGQLPLEYVSMQSFDLQQKALAFYAPFLLITLHYSDSRIEITSFHWDGIQLKKENLNPTLPYLWCSTSLYQTKENKMFQKLFWQTISEIKNLNHTLEFHRKVAQPLNSVNYLEKNKDIQTVSITNFTLKDSVSQIQYIDLIEEKIEIEKIELR